MSVFWNDIVASAEEPIEAVVIGELMWCSEPIPNFELIPKMKVITADEAKKWLSFETTYGFCEPNKPAVYAWTKNYILFVSQYDGSTSIERIPRNPVACEPYMPGG